MSRTEPLAIHDVPELRVKEGAIEVYTPQDLRLLLSNAPAKSLPFFAIDAFAGLRTQEIVRLEWPAIRFEQGVIEVAAEKAKTASHRLVPILPALREWLQPLQKTAGPFMEFRSYAPFDRARSRFCKSGIQVRGRTIAFNWKSNALRHSYASYRLAVVKMPPVSRWKWATRRRCCFATIANLSPSRKQRDGFLFCPPQRKVRS